LGITSIENVLPISIFTNFLRANRVSGFVFIFKDKGKVVACKIQFLQPERQMFLINSNDIFEKLIKIYVSIFSLYGFPSIIQLEKLSAVPMPLWSGFFIIIVFFTNKKTTDCCTVLNGLGDRKY